MFGSSRNLLTGVIATLFLVLSACSQSDENPNFVNGLGFNNGLNANCLNNQLNGNIYGNQLNNNLGNCGTTNFNNGVFTNYPRQSNYYSGYYNNYQSGFNSCPYGSSPVYHPGMGLGCIPQQHLYGMGLEMPYYNWNSNNFNFSLQAGVNIGNGGFSAGIGVNVSSGYGSGYGNGYYKTSGNHVLRGCDAANSCGNNWNCGQPSGSQIGVCTY